MRTSTNKVKEGKLVTGFDYETQKWVVEGVQYETTEEALKALKATKQ